MKTAKTLRELDVGVISDAIHYRDGDGTLHVIAPLGRQFDQWASIVGSVTVCAPLAAGPPPPSHRPYQAKNIALLPVPPGGGSSLRAKLRLLALVPVWWRAIQQLLDRVDAVHVRCPNNISIPGLVAVHVRPVLRHAIFTGNWAGYPSEPLTYRAQRYVLRWLFRGIVAVYANTEGGRIVPTFSPSITNEDWSQDSPAVAAKVARLSSAPGLQKISIATIGALDRNKNQAVVLRALRRILDRGLDAEMHLLGDGALRSPLETLARELGVTDKVVFHGVVQHSEVRRTCRSVDFVVQPSFTEGFTKVPVEALSAGAIPLLSNLAVNQEIVGSSGSRGRTFKPTDDEAIASIVCDLSSRPGEMAAMIENGRAYAVTRTLEAWREQLRQSLVDGWALASDAAGD